MNEIVTQNGKGLYCDFSNCDPQGDSNPIFAMEYHTSISRLFSVLSVEVAWSQALLHTIAIVRNLAERLRKTRNAVTCSIAMMGFEWPWGSQLEISQYMCDFIELIGSLLEQCIGVLGKLYLMLAWKYLRERKISLVNREQRESRYCVCGALIKNLGYGIAWNHCHSELESVCVWFYWNNW